MYVAFWKFSNNPPNYASSDDVMTFLMILHPTCTGPFPGGGFFYWCVVCLDKEKNSPALVHASGSEM